MQVKMIRMSNHGVKVNRRMLNDRSIVQHRRKLIISDKTNKGCHRLTKISRIMSFKWTARKLRDVSFVWANDGRIMLHCNERLLNDQGKVACYKQPWLCTLDIER